MDQSNKKISLNLKIKQSNKAAKFEVGENRREEKQKENGMQCRVLERHIMPPLEKLLRSLKFLQQIGFR